MQAFILWFNILSFTVLVAATLANALLYLKYRRPWLPPFLVYMGVYGLHLISQTWAYFIFLYQVEPAPLLGQAVGWTRLGLSLILAVSAPMFAFRLKPGAGKHAGLLTGLVAATLTLAGVIPFYLYGLQLAAIVVNLLFNAYLSALFFLGFHTARKHRQEILMVNAMPMLLMSTGTYGVLVILGLKAFITGVPVSTDLYIFVAGLTCFVWSVAGIILFIPFLRSNTPGMAGLPDGFSSRYDLSPREAEVIAAVVAGKSTKETAAELFISARTVEAHLYNAYRKCEVSSRSTLINKVRSWESGGL
jgi:DNA-binding CsgD family transcriptional regulator